MTEQKIWEVDDLPNYLAVGFGFQRFHSSVVM
jgi:hypothetical protein